MDDPSSETVGSTSRVTPTLRVSKLVGVRLGGVLSSGLNSVSRLTSKKDQTIKLSSDDEKLLNFQTQRMQGDSFSKNKFGRIL